MEACLGVVLREIHVLLVQCGVVIVLGFWAKANERRPTGMRMCEIYTKRKRFSLHSVQGIKQETIMSNTGGFKGTIAITADDFKKDAHSAYFKNDLLKKESDNATALILTNSKYPDRVTINFGGVDVTSLVTDEFLTRAVDAVKKAEKSAPITEM